MLDYQEVFITNLKRIRKSQSLTQAQLAELCDISKGTIGSIECGIAKPSFDLLIKFSEILQVPPACFFEDSSQQMPITTKYLEKLEEKLHKTIKEEFEKIGMNKEVGGGGL